MPESTVRYTIKRWEERRTLKDGNKSGRPRKLTKREEKAVVRDVRSNRRLSSAELSGRIETSFNKKLSPSTVRYYLRRNELYGRAARLKPFISDRNRRVRVQWARDHAHWTVEDWKNVIWSDEKKFCRLGSDGKIYVRRGKGEEFLPETMRGSVKGGGGSIMCWAAFTAAGPGPIHRVEGIMEQTQYRNILQNVLLPFGEEVGGGWIFQQDNDPKHTARSVKAWMEEMHLPVMEWPSQSPDLNPIEHLWQAVDKKVKAAAPRNLNDLERVLRQAWSEIPVSRCERLVESMPRRIQAVIASKGFPTRY